jgi:putative lipoic acid-binding regulatory protein
MSTSPSDGGIPPPADKPLAQKPSNQALNLPIPPIPPEQSLIVYPSAFPIKVMGANHDLFVSAVVAVALHHDPEFDAASLQHRPSSSGTYLGLTVTVTATSREQLDNIYRALTSLPDVKYVL